MQDQSITNLKVSPAYGRQRAVLSWTANGLDQEEFAILKSPDGVVWTPIGITTDTQFLDENFVVRDRLSDFHYKVTALEGQIESDAIGTFGPATREQFGAANVILQEWGRQLRQSTAVVICKQLLYAPVCPACTDPDTEQHIGISLCESCYGTGKLGGFAAPIPSFMSMVKTPGRNVVADPSGAGDRDTQETQVTMLAFPSLRQGDLIVDRSGDERYLVDKIDTFDVYGKLTVLYTVDISLLDRQDVRYKFPI